MKKTKKIKIDLKKVPKEFKRIVFLSKFIVLVLLFVKCGYKEEEKKVMKQEIFQVQKGINIAHFLSQSKKRGIERSTFFTEEDIKKIANLGFDHIRLPIDEKQMWDEDAKRHPEAFQLMENAIEWAIKNNLRVIVDLHILRSHHFNAEKKPLFTDPLEQEKFFDLWRDLSKTLKKYPNHSVAYELMNEAVSDDHETWNMLVAKAFVAIREIEKERTIVIGSNRWQSVNTFDALKVP